MITISQYFGKYGVKHKDVTPAVYANAQRLVTRCNSLMMALLKAKIVIIDNPNTGCQIAGEMNGGFRPQDCAIGAPQSAHKTGEAVDIYDPTGRIDDWLNAPAQASLLAELDMYFEAKNATIGWSHWSIRKPPSGRRFFIP